MLSSALGGKRSTGKPLFRRMGSGIRCIESLLNRHNRELALHLPKVTSENVHLSFWQQPILAAQLWLTYVERMLSFAEKHSEKVLLVTQRALFEGAPLIDSLKQKFFLDLVTTVASPYDPQLLNDKASTYTNESLSMAMQARLDVLWEKGLSLADLKSKDEAPILYAPESVSEGVTQQYLARLDKQATALQSDKVAEARPLDIPSFETTSEFVQWLGNQQRHGLDGADLVRLTAYINQHYPTVGRAKLELAKLYLKAQQFELAISYCEKANALGTYFPYSSMLMGQEL